MGSCKIDPVTGERLPAAEPPRAMSRAERRAAEQAAAAAPPPAPAPADDPKPARGRRSKPAEIEAPIAGESAVTVTFATDTTEE